MQLIRDSHLCINCLKSGHMVKQCPSSQKYEKCRESHHSLLDKDWTKKPSRSTQSSQSLVLKTHTCMSQSGHQQQVLLITSQVIAVGPNGISYNARALLDSGWSASFISEWVAQHLRLCSQQQDSKVSGIGGGTVHLSSQAFVNFTVKPVHFGGKTLKIEVLVLRKITSKLPSCSVAFNRNWKHLSNLSIVDPEFGVPGSVSILLAADVFSRTVLHSWRFDPSWSPSAIKMTFSWELAGSVLTAGIQSQQQEYNYCLAVTLPDDLLRSFWKVDDYNL